MLSLRGFSSELVKIARVDPYQQLTQWTCSAACLRAVLLHCGMDVSEDDCVQAVGTMPNKGAETTQIVEGAKKLGAWATEHSFESMQQAKRVLDLDIPIICDIQSFRNPGKGHYVVMTGIDEHGQVSLMDPNVEGNLRTISVEEMESRWWDHAMAPPHNLMPKWGVLVIA